MHPEAPLYTKQQLEEFEHHLRFSDDPQALLEEIGRQLPQASDPFSLAYLHYLVALGNAHIGNVYKVPEYIQAAEQHAKPLKDRELQLKIKALTIVEGVKWEQSKEIRAATIQEIIDSTKPNEHFHLIGLYEMVRQLAGEGNYAYALIRAYELLDKATSCNNIAMQQSAYSQLGFIHIEMDELYLALYYFERSYECSLSVQPRVIMLRALGNLAYINGRLGNLDECAKLTRDLIKEVKRGVDRNDLLTSSYMNLSNTYLLRGNIERAKYYHTLSAEAADPNRQGQQYRLMVHDAEIQIAASEHSTAIESLQKALAIGDAHNMQYHHRHIWKLLSLTYETLGEVSQAFAAYKEYTRLTQDDHKAILSAQRIMKRSQEDFKIAQESFKREHEHIAYLQETVSDQELAIAELSHKLTLNEKILHDFWHDLWKESPHLSAHFAELLKTSKLSEESKQHFSQPTERRRLANRFTQSLASLHPTLTPTELQVLVCSRLGLSGIETAAVMKTSDRTVEHHRQNARKKMNLPRSTSLPTYLASIDTD